MKISKRTAQKILAKRNSVNENFEELDFPQQTSFVNDTSRFLSAQCTRRAGKTSALAKRFKLAMDKYPKSQSIYLTLTLDSARDIMWPVLQELNDKYNWGCTFLDSRLTMTAPNGAMLKLYGADMKNFIKRLKGRKYPAAAIDEAQDFGTHLESLIDDVLTPSLADYTDSWLAVTGTPGPVPMGYFFKVTKEQRLGFSNHYWSINDNPYMPDPQGFIDKLKKDRGWDDLNPTYLREWCNRWVLDLESLWVRYKESVNHYDKLPEGKWVYLMGVDFGYKDADAIAILAWNEGSKKIYLVEEVVEAKQDITSLVESIKRLAAKYGVSKIVADEGALGKKMAEEMRRRHAIPIHAAEKQRKQENVAYLNDWLRLGNFMAKKDSRFAQDIIDAVLYAFKESPAYAYQPPEPKLVKGTLEWYSKEEEDMFQTSYEKTLEEYDAKKSEEEDPFGNC